jgi:hypothetical protein
LIVPSFAGRTFCSVLKVPEPPSWLWQWANPLLPPDWLWQWADPLLPPDWPSQRANPLLPADWLPVD